MYAVAKSPAQGRENYKTTRILTMFCPMLAVRVLIVSFFIGVLTACGGGGGGGGDSATGSNSSGSSGPLTQSLTFAANGPFTLPIGNTLTNPASGPGEGVVSYTPTNSAVATVDNRGVVTAVGVGSTTISATKAADSRYTAASSSYSVTVTSPSVGTAQTLTFALPGPLYMSVGSTLLNAATSLGSSPVAYSSSNTSIATVDSSGLVTALSNTGGVVITATKAADAIYASTSASYSLSIGQPSAVLQPQTISFSQAGPLTVAIGNSLSNIASGQGTGAITYSSSNPTMASVDAAGLVTAHAVGSAVITASKAADAHYAAATGAYTISAQFVVMNAWIGPNDTLLNFSDIASGVNLYLSSDANCDFSNYASCANGQLRVLSTTTITDTAATLTRPGYYSLQQGLQQQPFTVSGTYESHTGYEGVIFNNQLWLIGGDDNSGGSFLGYKNDVWSSTDGVSWVKHGAAPFSARAGHKLISFNGKLWLIGGKDAVGFKNDIWSSTDGVNWMLEAASSPFPARTGAGLALLNNRIWLVGGSVVLPGNYVVYYNDVWSSADGVNWVQENANASFSPRDGHQLVNFNGRLLVIGGSDDHSSLHDVWTSSDGQNWNLATANAAFDARSGHKVTELNGRLWLTGGSGYSFFGANDVWSSSDGITWVSETQSANFSARMGLNLLTYRNQLWVLGGCAGFALCVRENDVWSSADGRLWSQNTSAAPFTGRSGHRTITFNGRQWLIGGYSDGRGTTNDIWSTTDGLNWTQEVAHAPFAPRYNHEVFVLGNAIWVAGGVEDGAGNLTTDIWSSNDGVQWTQRAGYSNALTALFGYKLSVLNNKVWLTGGQGGINGNSIWSSADGVNWVEQVITAPFSARSGHQVVNYNGALWLIGGVSVSGGTGLNDVWMTADGVNWVQKTASAPFPGGNNYQVVVYENQLWVIGGIDNGSTWSSSDGINWVHHTQPNLLDGFSVRSGYQAFSYTGYLWVIGGWAYSDGGYKNDIWRSDDGSLWRRGFRRTLQ